jgi:IclR family acetate operon transcriptional repressor
MADTTAVRPMQSVGRALGLVEHLADSGGPLGLSDLAAACGLPLSTAHRLLRSLVTKGYLYQDRDRRYRLGPRLVALGGLAMDPVGPRLSPWLDRLVALTGETANAATLCDDAALVVAQVQSPHSMRSHRQLHERTMVHCSALGKALLSLLPDGQVVAIAARAGLPRRTHRTIATVEELLGAVAEVRRTGHAVDDEEEEYGARCVAVPVPSSPFPLAVSVTGPTGRVGRDRVEAIAAELARVVYS